MSDGLNLLCALVQAGSLGVFRDCSSEWFTPDEVPVYNYIRTHLRRFGRLPAYSTLVEETGVTVPLLEETIDYYRSKVVDRALYSELRVGFGDLRNAMRSFNMEEAKSIVEHMHRASRVMHTDSDIRTFDEAIADVYRAYEITHSSPGMSGVPTGWGVYDNITGGYQPADLVGIVARPELGKTYLLLRQVYGAWLAGHNTLCVTMEMSIEQITRRLVGITSGVNPDRIRKGTLSSYAQNRLRGLGDTLSGADRLRLYSGAFKKKISDIDTLIAEYRPDIVFIDGAYVVKSDSSGARANRFERVADMFDELKSLSMAWSIPVVFTTQFNRSAGKKGKDGSLETLAFSDALAMHCSLVVSVKEGNPPNKSTRRRLEFLKGREGEKGEVELSFEFNPVRIEPVVYDASSLLSGDGVGSVDASLDWTE